MTKYILFIIIITTSCNNKGKLLTEIEHTDFLRLESKMDALSIDEEPASYEVELDYEKGLDSALLVAKKSKILNESFDVGQIKVTIKQGAIFSSSKKNTYIRRFYEYGDVRINIYKGDDFQEIYSDTINRIEFVTDTIMDFNGDGLKDYDICTYGMSGCCRRYFHQIRLSNNKGSFHKIPYELLNPNFDIKNKIIRGVSYGYSGAGAELYKYKWIGLKIKPIECISTIYEIKKDTVIRRGYYKTTAKGDSIPLKEVPAEYKQNMNPDDYDWFIGIDLNN